MNTEATPNQDQTNGDVRVRLADDGDVSQVIALDALVTGVAKAEYWRDLHERYRDRRAGEGFFFIAESAVGDAPEVLGYVIGEVRAWEFGSAPCGWVFALSVQPETRQLGVGEHLLNAISGAFRSVGVGTMRTMISRDNHLLMSFFRSAGLMAGPYIQLEKELS